MASKWTPAQRAQAKILKQAGLYKAKNPRAAPKRSFFRAVKTYDDVISGRAKVVKAPSVKAAKAAQDKYDHAEVKRKGRSLIVGVQRREKLSYRPKTNEIIGIQYGSEGTAGGRYIRRLLPKLPKDDIESIKALMKPGELISVPYYRKGKVLEFHNMTINEFEAFTNKYYFSERKKNVSHYDNIFDYIELSSFIPPKPSRIRKAKS